MAQKLYGLVQHGNQFFYSMGKQEAFAIQIKPFPAAWKKTPGKSWQRTRNTVINCLTRGVRLLELRPFAEYDRSLTKVFRLVPSDGGFAYEPDWSDSIPYAKWDEESDWREIVSNLMSEIDPKVFEKLQQSFHFDLELLESIHDWPGFEDLLDRNRALAVSLAARMRVGSQAGERRSRLDYGSLAVRSEREIAAALGYGDSEEVVKILRKFVPDACTTYDLTHLPVLLEDPIARDVLRQAGLISHPALLFLRNPLLQHNLSSRLFSELARAFPTSLDILTCPWGPLLRGGTKADLFMETYKRALDVVQFYPDVVIESMEHLQEKYLATPVNRF